MHTVRNVVLVLGILTGFGLVYALVGLASNHFPHFVASSDYRGSLILLQLITAVPAFFGAAISGAVAAVVFERRNHIYWCGAALALVTISYVASYGKYWLAAESEDIVGVALAVVLIIAIYLSAHAFARRRMHPENSAG